MYIYIYIHICACSLVVLGLRNMEGTADPVQLVSRFLVRRSSTQIRQRIQDCCRARVPHNVIKVKHTRTKTHSYIYTLVLFKIGIK